MTATLTIVLTAFAMTSLSSYPSAALDFSVAAVADVPDDEGDVRATVEAFHSALSSGDSATAIAMLAPDVMILESGGFENLEEYRSHHLPGDIRFAQAIERQRGAMNVTVVGDVAWVTSSSVTQGNYNDREINSTGAELMVLSRTESGWVIRAIHWSSRRRSS
ncbi:MAG: nuclear transport factor 2 family protein [Gemmatimonadota bacterium]|nr:nuclear transport factor 2 family protein [Gemmatimonadota bacterium]MDH5806078.1 nuclear transport factor 2 family protein [Gemmatimonadota bacterium]